jgi:hypothetical protein
MRNLRTIAAFILTTAIISGVLFVLPSSAIEPTFRPTIVQEKYLYGIPERTTPEKLKQILPNAEMNSNDKYIKTGDTVVIDKKSYTVVILGDVDGDGYITSIDYQMVKRHYLGTYTITGDAYLLAACNDKLDGKIKAVTYLMIKRHVLDNFNMNMDYTGDESGWTSGWN